MLLFTLTLVFKELPMRTGDQPNFRKI